MGSLTLPALTNVSYIHSSNNSGFGDCTAKIDLPEFTGFLRFVTGMDQGIGRTLVEINAPKATNFRWEQNIMDCAGMGACTSNHPLLSTMTLTGLPIIPSLTYMNYSYGNMHLRSIKLGSIGTTIRSDSGAINWSFLDLDQESVDYMLALLLSLDGTNGTTLWTNTINMSGGTNSPPSAQGLLDKAALIARGCTVTTN
jgi:hypothetical protein